MPTATQRNTSASSEKASALLPGSLIGVVGSGTMGAGIAQVAAVAGYSVKLYDTTPEAVTKAVNSIRQNISKLVEKNRITRDEAEAVTARLLPASILNELADAQLVVEAVVENLDIKRRVFADLEGIVACDCILATNTSSFSVTAIAAGLKVPQRVVGMHFFNPVPIMQLVEVISGLVTDPALIDVVCSTAAVWGKSPVHVISSPGFIVNRVARPYYSEALRLLNERAATAATLDAVMRESGGFRMGPFELMDLIGLDVNFAVTQSMYEAFFGEPRYRPSLIQQEMVRAGFLGRKSGRGFYKYGEQIAAVVHTELVAPRPKEVTLTASTRLGDALTLRLANSGIGVSHPSAPWPYGCILRLEDAVVYLTDGRTATQLAHQNRIPSTVLVDLAFDYKKADRVALTKADSCSEVAYRSIVGLFQAAGYRVSRLDDVAGMAVMRTVAMLANEAADVVNQGVCTAEAVDTAMQMGVNYPLGPLAWADLIGAENVHAVLENLAAHYGEDRYRISPMIRRKVWNGARLCGE